MAQAVEELVANSIDAGARYVNVELDLPSAAFSCKDDGTYKEEACTRGEARRYDTI